MHTIRDSDFGVIFERRDRSPDLAQQIETADRAIGRYLVRSRSWRYRLARIVEWPAAPFLRFGCWLRGEDYP